MTVFIPIANAKPKKEISVIAKVISDVQSAEKDILKCRIGDESAIAEMIAWNNEKEKFKFRKGNVIKVSNLIVSERFPLFVFTKKTEVEIVNADIPNEKIYSTKFIDEIPSFGYVFIEGFVSRIFSIYEYYCKRCRKFTDEVCSCGNFSEKIFKINGIFSDSTADVLWTTNDEDVAEKIAKRKENEREIIRSIMEHNHKFFGYLDDKKFVVVDTK